MKKKINLQPEKTKKKINYCCLKFKESVKEGKFVSINDKKNLTRNTIIWHFDQKCVGKMFANDKNIDETEWFMPEWHHIYYCPFCGTCIKGHGFGTPLGKQ